jgi:transcriptional regulator with XRE-family HTH domain
MTFAEQLKAFRKRRGWTQADLAGFLSVSPRALWRWEKGDQPLDLTREGAIQRMAQADENHCN